MMLDIKSVKITVTSPLDNSDEIRKALGDAGAGIIGNYSYCSISEKCVGAFKGNDKSNPYIGEKNKLEFVEEEKIEVLCDIEKVDEVLKKLREVHPYEEPLIYIVPIVSESDLCED